MKKISKEIEDKIIELYINQKMSTTQVAFEIGISATGVSKIIKRRGFEVRSISKAKKGVFIGTKFPKEEIIVLYNSGKTSDELAKIFNCSKRSILNILNNNNVVMRKSGHKEDYQNPLTEDIKNLYLSGKSIHEVCFAVGLSYSGVNKILNKLNIIRTEDKGMSMLGKKMSKERIDKIRKVKINKKESGEYDHIYLKKTGYTFQEYQQKLPEIRKYYQKVRTITNQQPLNELVNHDKRGISGVSGAYHLDHKYSIAEGFKNNIDPEIIGNIINLEMIPWEENLFKNQKCSITKRELLTIYKHDKSK